MKKVISVVALAIFLSFLFSLPAMAAVKPTDSVQWDSGAKCTPYLSISGSTAQCKLFVRTENSSESILATLMLQKKNSDGTYSNVTSWERMTAIGYLGFTDSYSPVNSSNTYRLKAIIYVTGSGGTDTITKFAY